jgi:hypothetical protein
MVASKRDTGSTPWLVDLLWAAAARLGHASVFVNDRYPVGGDDHFSFIRRGIAACDIKSLPDLDRKFQ